MANRFSGSKEDFENLESDLRTLDSVLENYAKKHHMLLTKNYHNWPERSLTWTDENKKLIQIYLADENKHTYNFWICASRDLDGQRLWKQDYLVKEESFTKLSDALESRLDKALDMLSSWKNKDLVLAETKLA